MIPDFLGPRQMMAEVGEGSMRPMEMAERFGVMYTGDQPEEEAWICSEAIPRMVGMEGPQMSTSMIPVWQASSAANAQASWAQKVDLPTPPLPLRMRIFRWTRDMRERMRGRDGSGPVGLLEAHISWLAQPEQASALPAWVESTPGQWSGALGGTTEESGTADAMEGGWETASIVAVVVGVDVGTMKVVVERQEGCMLDVCINHHHRI